MPMPKVIVVFVNPFSFLIIVVASKLARVCFELIVSLRLFLLVMFLRDIENLRICVGTDVRRDK